MPFRLTPQRRQPEPPASDRERTPPSPLEVVLGYHEATKHHSYRFARSLGYLDWDTQPDPFRRYRGARWLPLDQVPPTPEPGYGALFRPGAIAPQPVDRHSISALVYYSLALSAWKEYGKARWSLRVNPSSGNLHPTEGYLLGGPVPDLLPAPALCHYDPRGHGLELRRELTAAQWQALSSGLPRDALLVGLASIHWRESWKYGERAFRYCQHDVGHAVAALALAAASLGWEVRLLESLGDAELDVLLGIMGQSGIEAEHADCLLAVYPQGAAFGVNQQQAFRVEPSMLEALAATPLAGHPNRLSPEHHDWDIIDAVAQASRRDGPPGVDFWQPAVGASGSDPLLPPAGDGQPARRIIRQRRSAVAMDGITRIDRETFYPMLARTLPGHPPFDALPWQPAIHLALFVHRVDGLAAGLYLLVRDPEQEAALRDTMDPAFVWQRPAGCPPSLSLFLLRAGDYRAVAQSVSCGQEIASHGVFALGMLAQYRERLRRHGPWFYRRLHWEAGAVGQVLYLEAEAAGLRGTGIGCFFDDLVHQVVGLTDERFQSLYHFTVGGPEEDPRLSSQPPYEHLAPSRGAAAHRPSSASQPGRRIG